jgi:hypothetical protein
MPDRLEQAAGMAGRARVVGQIADHQTNDSMAAPSTAWAKQN